MNNSSLAPIPVLAIDAGNTRIKWGLRVGDEWVAKGAIATSEAGKLGRDWPPMPQGTQALGSNVGGAAVQGLLFEACARHDLVLALIAPRREQLGVTSAYRDAAQLGADRWAALVAARQRLLTAELFPQPAVVVNVGTAVTVDALDGEGVFRGGLILPGLQLMLRSLADHTAGLKVPAGSFRDFPTNTGDALYSGATQAIAGAIRMMRARLASPTAEVKCFLSGGAAGEIAPHIDGAVEVVEHLVLEGVLALADTD